MVQAVIGIHVTVCVTLVILILLQQGKGAEVGAVFGGSSNTVFGASGAGNVLTRATSALAVIFFATSLYLAYTSSERASGSIFGSGSSVMSKHAVKA
ncbi:MAG TPA: preprotein translocase subunit SecG, partial [Candidatus Binataceae bacterium]|nr:preprotein translocase subunit SecG [Candidatus Binataceae bacterium]